MRLIDKNYKSLPKEYSFTEGEKILISEDAWCSYSFGVIEFNKGVPFIKTTNGLQKIVWEDNWIVE